MDWYPAWVADVPFETTTSPALSIESRSSSAGTDHEFSLSARVKLILVWFRTTHDECSYR
jgi:hypothetical protein